jgi:hypothetical protein
VAGPPVIIDVDADSLPASPNSLPGSRATSVPEYAGPEVIDEENRPDKIVPEDVQEVELEDVPEIVQEDVLEVELEDVPEIVPEDVLEVELEDVPDAELEDVPEITEENIPEDVLVDVPSPDYEHSLDASKGEYRHFDFQLIL